MELSKEKVIDIIKELPKDITLKGIIDHLEIINKDKTIAMEVAEDKSLEEMIAASREAYRVGDVITTTKLIEKLSQFR